MQRRREALIAIILVTGLLVHRAIAGGIEVKLGTTLLRTWDQVKADKFVYGPKQDFDSSSGETHIYLPYGSNAVLYDEVRGALTDVGPSSLAMFHSSSGNDNAVLSYKLHFDRRIGTFRFHAGWTELGLGGNTVAGAEYSEDAVSWKTIRQVKGADKPANNIEPLVEDFKATDLNTDTLYVRLYTRDPSDPDANGPGRWLQVRLSGDPRWRDVATEFFHNQLQVWATPVKPGTPPRASRSAFDAQSIKPRIAARAFGSDPTGDASPWGVGSGAEWSGDYPRFDPMLESAGVHWLRLFPEWQTIQPRRGQWNWKTSDSMAADAQAHRIQLLGTWAYLAPWASADGGTRKFPIRDIQFWRDYISGTVARYRNDVKYWEVWNEFNGSFGDSKNKVQDYARLVVAACDAAKKIDPEAKVGLSVANFDVGFLDAVIKAGARDHFDFICVHPYENLAAVGEGGEVDYLSLAGNLRKMLAANNQPKDMPLWITEVGYLAPVKANAEDDQRQAVMLTKAYVLSIAQGFQRIFWFEARGPSYGNGQDFGILRSDWTPRRSYDALKTMTSVMGPDPHYVGWLNVGDGGFGFVFKGAGSNVLAAWAPTGEHAKPCSFKLDAEVTMTDLAGKQSSLPAGAGLTITPCPIFISNLPRALVAQAQTNRDKPYPWGGDYASASVVTCRLGATNADDGLKQFSPKTTVVVNDSTASYRRPDFENRALNGEGRYVYFRVDPQFVPFGTKELSITIVAKRISPEKPAGMNLTYESAKGYRGADKWWAIPEDGQWHEYTWTLGDANFVGQWGWNFRFDAVSSPNAFLVKEVRVRKVASPPK
jgi:hypothetical protein